MPAIANTDLDVYPLCLGTNTFGWTSSPEESFQVLDEYAGAGGNFLDTADVYSAWAKGNEGGESERIIGEWWGRGGKRDEIVLATKIGKLAPLDGLKPQIVKEAVDNSLRRLKTDHIDILYAHAEDPDNPTDPELFEELRQAGKIRYYALSNHRAGMVFDCVGAADAAGVPRPVALQPHYNLLHRKEFERGLQPLAEELELAVMPYFSLAAGLLTGKYNLDETLGGARAGMVSEYIGDQTAATLDVVRSVADEHNVEPAAVAIAWLLAQPTVVAPIASARVPKQLSALFEGVSIVLEPEEIELLNSVSGSD